MNYIDPSASNNMSADEYYNYLMGQRVGGGTPLPSPSAYWDKPIQERLQDLQGGDVAPDVGGSIRGSGNNLLKNALANMAEIGTGITYLGSHPFDVAITIGDYLRRNDKNPYKIMGDVSDMVTSPYNFKLGDIGNKTIGQMAAGAIIGAYEHPIDAALDITSLGGWELLKTGLKATKAGQNALKAAESLAAKAGLDLGGDINKAVQGGLDVSKAEVKKALADATKPIQKEVVRNANPEDLTLAVKSAEEGTAVTGKALEAKNALREYFFKWNDVVKKYSPHTWVDPQDLSIIQKIVRATGDTYATIRKKITPILDTLKEENGLGKVEELAKSGNTNAQRVLEAKQLYDKGEIFPVTHGIAEVKKIQKASPNRIMNKRFSTREFGNASYEDIAEQLMRPSEYLEELGVNFANTEIARQILQGEKLGGVSALAPTDAGKAVYVPREAMEQAMRNEKDIHEVLKSAQKEKVLDDDIPLDETTAKILENKTERRGAAMSGVVGDLTRLAKQSTLGAGSYLGGNAITAAFTALLNSGPMIISDMIKAAKSKGKLLQDLGLYRTDAQAAKMHHPITQAISNINDVGGGKALRWVDRKIQNWWGEVAAHAALRKAGVRRLSDATKVQLADIIHNTRRGGLLNDPVSSLPSSLTNILGPTNPFFNWVETATKSTYHQFKNAPFLSNVVLTDVLANIGYDKEMQNRLNLRVKSDKPYVSYKFDDKTGEVKESTVEYLPITSSFKFLNSAGLGPDAQPASVPLLSDLLDAMQGKDRYGRPLKRAMKPDEVVQAIGDNRWRMNPQTGEREKIGGQADEILATAIKDVLVPTSLWNRTLAPALGGVMGMHYNQPYAQSILGDYSDSDAYNNILIGGNPEKPRTGMDVIRAISGRSQYPYYEDRDYMTPSEARKFMKGVARQRSRRLD